MQTGGGQTRTSQPVQMLFKRGWIIFFALQSLKEVIGTAASLCKFDTYRYLNI
jgi:hypothetical protein